MIVIYKGELSLWKEVRLIWQTKRAGGVGLETEKDMLELDEWEVGHVARKTTVEIVEVNYNIHAVNI